MPRPSTPEARTAAPVTFGDALGSVSAAYERLIAAGRVRRITLTPHLLEQRRRAFRTGDLALGVPYTFERMLETVRRFKLGGHEFRCALYDTAEIARHNPAFIAPVGDKGPAVQAMAFELHPAAFPEGPNGGRYHYSDPLALAATPVQTEAPF